MRLRTPAAAKILYQPARYKGLYGGRGSGKSTSAADALVLKGAVDPLRTLCAREIQKSLRTSVYQLLRDRIEANGLGGFYDFTERGIFGANGTQFLFAGLRTNPDSIKSMEGLDIAWVEEADRASQQSLDLLTPTLRKDGSELWFTWNRRNKKDAVDNLFLGGTPPPGALFKEMNWRDNPFFPSVLREEMLWLKGRDRDKWLHVWEGQPLERTDAKVFHNWTEGDLDDLVEKLNPVARFGADWGMRDPTVVVKVYIIGRKIYIAEEAYKVNATIDEIPALFAGSDKWREKPRWENKFSHVGVKGIMEGKIVADSASPQTIRYLKDRGFSIVGAVKGAGSIEEGVEFLKAYEIVVHPSCTHCIDELNQYKYEEDPDTEEILPKLADKDNHVIDAIRYAVEADRRKGTNRTKIATATEAVAYS